MMLLIEKYWYWVVAFGSFMIHVICDGICYSFGVVFSHLLHQLPESVDKTAWITSVLFGVTLGAGPIASALANHFGCRRVVMAGSVIAACGSAASAFATSVFYLVVSVGLVMGFGFSLMFCPSIIIVNLHFRKKRALAVGLAVCGAGIGTFIIAPISTELLRVYEWRGTFIVYSGIILNGLVFGMLFRKPHTQRIRVDGGVVVMSQEVVAKSQSDGSIQRRVHEIVPETSGSPAVRKAAQSAMQLQSSKESPHRLRCFSEMNVGEYHEFLSSHAGGHIHLIKPIEEEDLFFFGGVMSSQEDIEEPETAEVIEVTDISRMRAESMLSATDTILSEPKPTWIQDMLEALKKLTDLSLLKEPAFLAIALSNVLTNIGYDLPRIFLPEMAQTEHGLSDSESSWLGIVWDTGST